MTIKKMAMKKVVGATLAGGLVKMRAIHAVNYSKGNVFSYIIRKMVCLYNICAALIYERNLIISILIILHLMTIPFRSLIELVIKWWQKVYR